LHILSVLVRYNYTPCFLNCIATEKKAYPWNRCRVLPDY